MSKSQRDKGKRGEREVVILLKAIGYENARRTSQYCGQTGDASDVIGVEGHHLEVKRQEQIRIMDWMEQAERDCENTEKTPVVVFRKSGTPWYVCLSAIDYFMEIKNE